MSLLEGRIGFVYVVDELVLEGATERRLEALGLTEGTRVTVLNNKRSGSVIFKVRGTRLAVGKKIAESIRIREEIHG